MSSYLKSSWNLIFVIGRIFKHDDPIWIHRDRDLQTLSRYYNKQRHQTINELIVELRFQDILKRIRHRYQKLPYQPAPTVLNREQLLAAILIGEDPDNLCMLMQNVNTISDIKLAVDCGYSLARNESIYEIRQEIYAFIQKIVASQDTDTLPTKEDLIFLLGPHPQNLIRGFSVKIQEALKLALIPTAQQLLEDLLQLIM